MAIFVKTPNTYSLTGNPMPVQVAYNGENVVLEVLVGGEVVFQSIGGALGDLPIEFDIAGVLKPLFSYGYQAPGTELVEPLPGRMLEYSLRAYPEGNDAFAEMVGGLVAFLGGVGNESYQQLNGSSYAEARYARGKDCFILSTRAIGDYIALRSSEAKQHLTFLHRGDGFISLIFICNGVSRSWIARYTAAGMYGINLSALEELFSENFANTPTDIRIAYGNVTARIFIDPSNEVKRSLIFRNSLGAYERISISGYMNKGSEVDGSAAGFRRFLNGISSNERDRAKSKDYAEGVIGWKNQHELTWIKDLLISDDVLLDSEGVLSAVNIDAEALTTRRDDLAPASLKITLQKKYESQYVEDSPYGAIVAVVAWGGFICEVAQMENVMVGGNTGVAFATALMVNKTAGGVQLVGYPKTYSMLAEFFGPLNGITFPAITADEWSRTGSGDRARRRNNFMKHVSTSLEPSLNIENVLINTPERDDVAMCPIPRLVIVDGELKTVVVDNKCLSI